MGTFCIKKTNFALCTAKYNEFLSQLDPEMQIFTLRLKLEKFELKN